MNKQQIIQNTVDFVKEKLSGEGTGHGWWHIQRVWNNAKHIAEGEDADLFIVELAALLHDIADWKFHDEEAGPRITREWLKSQQVDEQTVERVTSIVKNISFKGAKVENKITSKEGLIVQDADRLDALGAIGIARAFAYGGSKGREIYNPNIKPTLHKTSEDYKKGGTHTINHFYEKLLLLKDMMNTETGKKLAQERHAFLQLYLDTFYEEWEGKK